MAKHWKRSDITDQQAVDAARRSHDGDGRFALDILIDETGAPEKVAYAAMERAHGRGLIDYGVSLRSAWAVDR